MRFAGRHRDLVSTFSHHADRIANRLDPDVELSEERWLLLGATFTHEYAVEAASLCNPSIVAHPDQTSAPLGGLRVVLSVRGIGEGHLSTHRVPHRDRDRRRAPRDRRSRAATRPWAPSHPGVFDRAAFHGHLRALGQRRRERGVRARPPRPRPSRPTSSTHRLAVLTGQRDTRRNARATATLLRSIAARSYARQLPRRRRTSPSGCCGRRWRRSPTAWRTPGSCASSTTTGRSPTSPPTPPSTAWTSASSCCAPPTSGTFESSPMSGPAAVGKGLALFPRRIGGRFAALSRHDRERNSVAFSDSLDHWGTLGRRAGPAVGLGDAPARQLRLADRDRAPAGSC